MLQGFHTCNRACSQSSLKRAVIALLHVAVIHHRITLYKDSITPAASPAQHVNQPMLRVIRWTVNGGFADMFLGSSSGYEIRVARHQMQLHLAHSLQLLQQPLPLLLRAQKQTPLKQELHRCSVALHRLFQGLTVMQRSPVTPRSLRRLRACSRPGKTGVTAVCQTCARSVRHPVTRLKPHGGTTVPSKLRPWYRPNPVLTGKTGTRGTTSRRRYRLNDPWYHPRWYRLFSPSLRHFAHLTLPNGRWRWIR